MYIPSKMNKESGLVNDEAYRISQMRACHAGVPGRVTMIMGELFSGSNGPFVILSGPREPLRSSTRKHGENVYSWWIRDDTLVTRSW